MTGSDDGGQGELFASAEVASQRPKRPRSRRRPRAEIAQAPVASARDNVLRFPTAGLIFGDLMTVIEVAREMLEAGYPDETAQPALFRAIDILYERAARAGMSADDTEAARKEFCGLISTAIRLLRQRA